MEIVLSKILADAQAEARRIEASGASESAGILGAAKESAGKIVSKAESSARQKTAYMRRSELARVNSQVRIARLNAKNELIKGSAAAASTELSKLSQAQRKKYYSRLLKMGAKELEPRYFYCRAEDRELVSSLSHSLSFAGEIPCSGGFVLEDADKKIRVDYTFEALMEKILSEKKKMLLKVLFDKNA